MARAFLTAVAGIGLLTCMDALIKAQTQVYGTLQVTLMRFIVGGAATVLLVLALRAKPPNIASILSNFWRTTFAVIAALSFYYGIGRIPLAQAMALWLLAPCFTALFGLLILREPMTRPVAVALALGLIGMVLIVGPSTQGAGVSRAYLEGVAAILLAMASYALSLILLRSRATRDHVLTIVTVHNVGAAILIAPLLALQPQDSWKPIDLATGLGSLAIGLLGVAGHLMMARAYGRAPANVLASGIFRDCSLRV